MEKSILDNNSSMTQILANGIRRVEDSTRPIAAINTEYDRELNQSPVDDYEALYNMTKDHPEDTLKEYNWIDDATTTFMNQWDNIDIMTAGGELVKDINPTINDINFELSYLQDIQRIQELDNTLNSLDQNSYDYSRLLTERNSLADSLRSRKPQYDQLLVKYDEVGEDEDIPSRINALNESLTSFENRRNELEDRISNLRESIEERGRASADYRLKEQRSQNASLTDSDYWKYTVPGMAGSSAQSLVTNAQELAGAFGLWLGKKGAMSLFGGPVGTGAAVVSSVFDFAQVANSIYNNLQGRSKESYAQVYGAYKDRIDQELQNQGIDKQAYISAARQQMLEANPNIDPAKLDDDQVMDAILLGKVNVDDEVLSGIKASSANGLQEVYNNNMALSAIDIAQSALTIAPVGNAIKRLVTNPIGKAVSKVGTNTAIGRTINNTIDKYTAFNARMAHQSPKKFAALQSAKALARLGFAAVGEGFEEGNQDIFDYDYAKAHYDDNSTNLLTSLSNLAEANYRTAKILSGIDTESELANDPQFWNDVKGGFALGLFMGGVNTAITETPGIYKEMRANTFVRDMVLDQINKKDRMAKTKLYADKAANTRLNYTQEILDSIERYKAYKPDGITDEDIDTEKEAASRAMNLTRSKTNRNIAKAADIPYGSEDYSTLIGLQTLADEDYQEAVENARTAENAINQFTDTLISNQAIQSLPADQQATAASLTSFNIMLEGVRRFREALQSDALQGKAKFGITDKSNPIAKELLAGLDVAEKRLTDAANQTAEGTQFDAGYIADPSLVEQGSSTYMNSLLAGADLEVSQGKKNEMYGSMVVDGKLTNFDRLSDENKVTAANRVKSRVARYNNDYAQTENTVNRNARDLVETQQPEQTQTATDQQEETKSNIFNPQGQASVDTTIPTPHTATQGQTNRNLDTELNESLDPWGDTEKVDNPVETQQEIEDDIPLASTLEETKPKKGQPTAEELEEMYNKFKAEREKAAEEAKVSNEKQPTETPSKEGTKETEIKPIVASTDDDFSLYDVNDLDNATTSSDGVYVDDAGEHFTQDKDTSNKTEEVAREQTVDETEKQIVADLERAEALDKGLVNPLDDLPEFEGLGSFDKVSKTLFYNQNSDTPMIPGYKPGKELRKILDQPGALINSTYEFIIDSSYIPRGEKPYEPGDSSTYNSATILLVIHHPTGNYLMSLKTPKSIRSVMKGKPEREIQSAIYNLTIYRNEIIKAIENNPNATVAPQFIRRSNGVYNVNTRVENGVTLSVQRSIADIPALNDTDETNFGIGTGFTPDPVNRFVIFGHQGEVKPGHGGSGQLFIYPKPQYTLSGNPELPIQVNIKRFSKAQALSIAKMLKRFSNGAMAEQATPFGASAIELLHFVARFSPRTEIKSNDQRFDWLKEKQFFLDKNGNLHLGTKVYRNFSNAADEQVEEVAQFIADTMHWRVDKTTFYGSINDAFPNSNFKVYFDEHPDLQQVEILPGVVVTRDQADRNISAMQWMKESGLLQSNLQDLLFTDPFMFAEGVAIEKTSEPIAPDNTPTNTSTFNDQIVNNTDNPIVATTTEDEEETRRHIEENAKQLDQGKFDILDWVDDLMDEPEGAPRKITREYKETITPEEIEWVKNKLGISSDQIEITENAIALGNDTYAMGLARAYSIVLWKAAERGTAYHEAFHRVSLLLLTPKERQRIYETYRNRNGYVGTDQMVEEELAEEFRQYMLNRTEPRLNIVRRMFNAIKNFISKWITHSDTTIDNIFDRIQSGYFKDSVLNKQSLEEFKQGYHNVGAPFKINGHELRTITNTQFNEVVDSLTSFAIQTAGIQQFADVSSINLSQIKDKFNPETVQKAVASGRLTQAQGNIWNEIYERFDDVFVPSITTKLKNYQLDGVRKQENIDAELDAKQDADGGAVADQMAQYTYDALEVSAKNNALTSVKIFIATLPAAEFKNGKLVSIRSTVTGLPLTVKFDEMMNSALNELCECNTFDDIIKTTYEKGKTVPAFKILNNKLRKLTTPIEGETETQKIAKENLQTQILNTFRKAKHEIIGVISGFDRMSNGDSLSNIVIRNESSGREVANQVVGFTNELIRNSKLLSFDDNQYSITKEGEQTINKIQSNLSKLKAFVNKNRNANPKAISDSIPRMKNIILAYLNEAGLKIDLDTLNTFMSKNYSNPDPVEEFSKFITDNSRSGINYFFTNTLPALKSIQPSGKIVRTVNGKEYSVNLNNFYKNNAFVKGIAEAYVLVNPNPTELTVLAPDGKLFYPISDHNYLSDMTQKLDTNDKVVTDLTRVTYAAGSNTKPNYCKGSTILTELLNNPSGRGKISVKTFAYFEQSKSRDRGRKYMEVSPLEDYTMKMALTQQGHMLLPTMGDSGTYNTLYGSAIKNFAKPLTIRKAEDGSMSLSFSAEVLDRMINYFETELDTIKQNYANEDFVESHPERKIKNYHTDARNGYRFRYFGGFFKINGKDGDLNTFNDALKLSEEADKEQGTHENVQNVLNQITSDWNKHSTTEKYAMMNSMLMEVFKGELNYAQELGVITWDGKKFASVKNQAIPQRSLSEAASHYEGLGLNMEQERALGATELLANYFANSIWNIIEFEKLYVKDPAYYKNPVDKIKRLREALSTGVTPRLDYPEGHPLAGITEVNVGMLSDNVIVSREFAKINEKAKRASTIQLLQTMQNMSEADAVAAYESGNVPTEVNDAADVIVKQKFGGYSNVNQTDATVLISPDMYQQLVRRIDGWTPEVQRAFEVLNDPNANYDSDPDLYNEALAVTLKPLKFMYFGDHFDAELGLDIPIFDKMAMFPVHRIFSTGDAKAIYDVMTNPDKPIHMLAFESAVKVGQYTNKPSIYTDKTNTAINVEGLGSIVTHKQSLANFRRQLITDPHHSSTQMFVSQAQKAATGNIRKNNTYTTPSGESLTGQELIDSIRNTMNALTLKGRESVEQRFNITTDEDGVPTADSATFASVIQRDAIQSGMNQNVIEGLQARPEGGTVAPISGLSDNTWIESKLISSLNKYIIDNNLPGGMFIQMSSILYNKLVVNTDKEQQRKLNYCNDDGSMDAVISINLLKHFIPDYEHKTFKEAKDWLLKAKVIGPDSGILAMGYRIPAQGQSSTVALKIVDIYPEQIGDTITLPDEFTALTGSDFDEATSK